MGAVSAAVAGREELGCADIARAEALDVGACGDDLRVAVRRSPVLAGVVATAGEAGVGPAQLRSVERRGAEGGVLRPDPAVDHADDDAAAGACRRCGGAGGAPRGGGPHTRPGPR